jgi:Trypsin
MGSRSIWASHSNRSPSAELQIGMCGLRDLSHAALRTTHKCSGTLVSPTLILTAAHCIVCTDSVTAQVYGDVSFFDDPLPGAAPTKKHESVSVAFDPAAYPTLPNCVGGDAAVFAEINKTTLWGADVAVVTLAEPVASVVPARMLLFPTRGFSPPQDLDDQPLALVGRGFPRPAPAISIPCEKAGHCSTSSETERADGQCALRDHDQCH